MCDGKVVSLTKQRIWFSSTFLYIFIKSLKWISDEWFDAVYWSSLLFGLFMTKRWVEFSLTSFGTLKHDCGIKTREMLNFLSLLDYVFYNHISNHIIKNY